ncbi:MAG: hypothetical protein ACRBCI_10075 [Cellvibrionaceae bacterium]
MGVDMLTCMPVCQVNNNDKVDKKQFLANRVLLKSENSDALFKSVHELQKQQITDVLS